MFDMTANQKQAFSDAANGVSAQTFNHIILFIIGVFATIWLFFIFLGIWHEMKDKKMDFGEALGKFAFAILVYTAMGVIIFY